MAVNAVGNLNERTPFLQYRKVGIEFTYATNCVIDSYVPTTGVDVVARNVVNSKKTPTEVVNEYRQERGFTDPTQSRLDQVTNKLTIVYNVTTLCHSEQFMSALATEVKKLKPGYPVELQPLKEPEDYKERSGQKVFLYLFVSASRFDPGGLEGALESWLPGTC